MLNPTWLDTFITLVETGNFTRTAEQRFMTQPGVSQHLKKLEEACRCELVVRLGKGIQLTEQGRRVYEYARAQINKEQDFIESLQFDAPFEGKCVVACSGAIAQRIYPALLKLQSVHRALTIHVEVAPRRTILQGIRENSIALGIVTNSPSTEDIDCTYVGEETLALILPKTAMPIKGSKDGNPIPINRRLNQLGLINHPDAMHYLQRYIKDSGEEKLASLNPNKLPHSGYINQLSQILLPVSEGHGFTVLPKSTLAYTHVASKLTVHDGPNEVTEPLYCVQTPHSSLPARYQLIKDTLHDVLS
jgi:DNA-binding transcriptional LysR family regulator